MDFNIEVPDWDDNKLSKELSFHFNKRKAVDYSSQVKKKKKKVTANPETENAPSSSKRKKKSKKKLKPTQQQNPTESESQKVTKQQPSKSSQSKAELLAKTTSTSSKSKTVPSSSNKSKSKQEQNEKTKPQKNKKKKSDSDSDLPDDDDVNPEDIIEDNDEKEVFVAPSNDDLAAPEGFKKLQKKLEGAQFRWINEKLYTSTGKDAKQLFTESGELAKAYHQGFRDQVEGWPLNPLDVFINDLKKTGKGKVIADFGCGEARLAKSLKGIAAKVHSFDLYKFSEDVTVCEISSVPLEDMSVDIAVYCLSLMGTNFMDFLEEGWRVLKKGGLLKIAEVKSRFYPNLTEEFINSLNNLGFDLVSTNEDNKMFVLFDFVKRRKGKKTTCHLKPCVYKKR